MKTPMKVGSRRTGAAMHFKGGWKYTWVLAGMKVNVEKVVHQFCCLILPLSQRN